MQVDVIQKGTIYRGTEPNRKSCCFPRICVNDNRWICSFRSAPNKESSEYQETLLCWSDDQGKSWCEPFGPFKPQSFSGIPGVFREAGIASLPDKTLIASLWWVEASNPKLPLFNWETEGLLKSLLFQSRSFDNGCTWSKPERVNTGEFQKSTAIDSHMLYTQGLLLYPFEQYKLYDEESDWLHYSAVMISKDLAKTWEKYCITGHDPEGQRFYWDQRPCVLEDGSVLFFFDTFEKGGKTCGITARRYDPSTALLSPLWDTGVVGQPGYPVELPDGVISMVYNDRGYEPGIKLRLSFDSGRSFPEHYCYTLYEPKNKQKQIKKLNLEQVMEELNKTAVFGFPCQRLLPNNEVIMCYYAGETPDTTDICWMHFRFEGLI